MFQKKVSFFRKRLKKGQNHLKFSIWRKMSSQQENHHTKDILKPIAFSRTFVASNLYVLVSCKYTFSPLVSSDHETRVAIQPCKESPVNKKDDHHAILLTLQGTITYPTWGSWENHLKSAFFGGDMLVPRSVRVFWGGYIAVAKGSKLFDGHNPTLDAAFLLKHWVFAAMSHPHYSVVKVGRAVKCRDLNSNDLVQ